MFTTDYSEIINNIENIDPIKYSKTRNFLNGSVTRLSPYISRGVISTKQIAISVLKKGYNPYEIETFLKELAWRDYFQQVWRHLKDDINKDIKQKQLNVSNYGISTNIIESNTSINAIDLGIKELYETGYMHNHMRMYVASICCNIAQSHWLVPSKWMYYHLLDADWASNSLSWQWVAGSFSNKKYFANQENINKYSKSEQYNTFLDINYQDFEKISTSDELKEISDLNLETILPDKHDIFIDKTLPTYIYNFYNLDFMWDKDIKSNRVLLLEPILFKKYPICQKTIQFLLELSKSIPELQIYVGEFNELLNDYGINNIHFKEHPLNSHYKGVEHSREWIFDTVTEYYPSFFSYWKKCEKHIKNIY